LTLRCLRHFSEAPPSREQGRLSPFLPPFCPESPQTAAS